MIAQWHGKFMNDRVVFTSSVTRWTGTRGGSWYLVTATGSAADALTAHALMRRLEEGRRRGFGSVKVAARIGDTRWLTSVFPQGQGEWVMLIKSEVRRAECIAEGDEVELALELV